VLALGVGGSAMAVLAWQVGELLSPGPTEAQLTDVGARVTTGLQLGGLPALAIAPLAAVLAYVVPVLYTRGDDLGRTPTGDSLPSALPSERAEPREPDFDLVDVPPPGRPSA
jgi:hypothetical protein